MPKEYRYTLSIITVNYNGLKDTCSLIDTLPLNDLSIEVIIIDNGSKQNEANEISLRYKSPSIKAIRSEKNLGFAGGNNIGIEASTGKYLLFINNDTIFKNFNISPLISRLQSSPNVGIISPKIIYYGSNETIQYAGYTPLSKITMRNKSIGNGEKDGGQYNTAHPTPYAHGAAMLIPHDIIKRVGMMPECYFLYYEELDWSMMFRRAGYEIYYDPSLTIYHKESQSTGIDSPLRTFYITRNRLLFVKRNIHTISKPITYIYLIFIVSCRDIIKNIYRKRYDLAKATLLAINSLIKNKI